MTTLKLPVPLTLAQADAAQEALHRALAQTVVYHLERLQPAPKARPLAPDDYELTPDGFVYADRHGREQGPLAYEHCTERNLRDYIAELTRSAGAVPEPPLSTEVYSRTSRQARELTELVAHAGVSRPERTQVLLSINTISEANAARKIDGLRRRLGLPAPAPELVSDEPF